MKRIKHFINSAIWALLALYVVTVAMVNIPMAQSFIGRQVAQAIADKLGTPVSIGRVDVGLFNRLIVDDVSFLDQQGKVFFKATRLSVKLDCIEALYGHISVTSAQIFGMKARLYRATSQSPLNIQYVVDSLASKDTTTHNPLNLQVNSLIIRHGELCYDQLDAPHKSTLDLHHLQFSGISAHIILNTLREDSLNLKVKKIALNERSGLQLKSLSFKLAAGPCQAHLEDFELSLPHSRLVTDNIAATYRTEGKYPSPSTLRFRGEINTSYIRPSDLGFVQENLKRCSTPLVFEASFSGTSTSLRVKHLEAIVARDAQAKSLSAPTLASLSAKGSLWALDSTPHWSVTVNRLTATHPLFAAVPVSLPAIVQRLEDVRFNGTAEGQGHNVSASGNLSLNGSQARLAFKLKEHHFDGHAETDGIDIGKLLDDNRLGYLAGRVEAKGNLDARNYTAHGVLNRFDWNQYAYKNITIDASYGREHSEGKIDILDPNFVANAHGRYEKRKNVPSISLDANVSRLNPTALNLTGRKHAGTVYSGTVSMALEGSNLSNVKGKLVAGDFHAVKSGDEYHLDKLEFEVGDDASGRYMVFDSDFGHGEAHGHFDLASLRQAVENLIVSQLPSIRKFTPLRHHAVPYTDFTLETTITRGDWLRHLLDLPLEINEPVSLYANMKSHNPSVDFQLTAPDVVYANRRLRNVSISLTSPENQLRANVCATQVGTKGTDTDLRVTALAQDDELTADIQLDNHAVHHRFAGHLSSAVSFARNRQGVTEAHFDVRPSEFSVGDTLFTVLPASIVYSKNHLRVNDLEVSNGHQYVKVSGAASRGSDDSITVELKDVNVEYVLDLVGFHSVDFSGLASGKAFVTHLFDGVGGHGALRVSRFRFEEGNMGTLLANVGWNKEKQQIDIDAQAIDTLGGSWFVDKRLTSIKGYVSPKRNYIDLDITANDTRGDFVQSFCSSFMDHCELSINGDLRLWGDLKQINLTGDATVDGKIGVKPLNTTYELRGDSVHFLVNEIRFANDTLRDRNANVGVVNGSLYHQHLSRLTYDIDLQLHHLLGYDWDGSDGSSFYGTVYASGNARIKGRSGRVDIDIDATPEKGSQVVYNASNPDAIASREFIRWSSRDTLSTDLAQASSPLLPDDNNIDIPTDIHINFLINTHPDATLKVIMDNSSGDYIALNGAGVMRASYYNKGGVDVYGNYLIDHGVYKLTIQNIIKRNFEFLQGGSIAFGGDPYNADLSLKAQYQVNSVSLADLQLGRSFSSNNIRVNCLMNISGTPNAPKVDFGLDMPTVGTDAKQMIYSIINSEEEMNQQVLYLLAVGRFLSPSSNNSLGSNTGEKQTSLAMQSILSGQISQQINNVLGNVVNNSNWNFGANISTGTEGWNDAEYEGLLSGRMLNNRLLINGQFGYRDNANATTSFIGDFDIRYLFSPNGNFSVRVYNQTNDRYFTRNSLNTQGIGFVIKRDFNGWRDLLGLKLRHNKTTQKATTIQRK